MNGDAVQIVYRVRTSAEALESRAEALLLEQTVELPRSALRWDFVRREMVGRVVSTVPVGEGEYRVTIEQPEATTGGDPAQLLNVVFGNSSLQPDVELEDVRVPPALARALGGPRFGIAGLRTVAGVSGRALTATAIKPMGLSAQQAGGMCRAFALGGIDVIKDDHGLADHAFCPFGERIRACLDATARAAQETGRRSVYAPNLIGGPSAVMRQAEEARGLGARAVVLSPMVLGLPVVAELVRDLGMVVLAHPALVGVRRIHPEVLLGVLFPLYGADAVIYPNAGGRFSFSRETCAEIARLLRTPRSAIAPAMPVPAGGIRPERVPEVLAAYGADTMLLIGGGLIEPAEDTLVARCRQFAESVQAFGYGR
jgi:ribulose-bisphosphate carboxylase large chain